MTYVDWIKKFPLPRNNIRLDPSDILQSFHRRMWAR